MDGQKLHAVAPYLSRHETTNEFYGIKRCGKRVICKKLTTSNGQGTTERTIANRLLAEWIN